jgi:AraC-like DNA-binding protein
MSEPDGGGWRAARFVRQLQLACGECAGSPVDGRAAAAVLDAVESLAWPALDTPAFVVTRGILLAFLVKLARRGGRLEAMVIEIDALASATPADVPMLTGRALRSLIGREPSAAPTDWRVNRVLMLVRDRARETLRVDELARAVGISRWHLERLTKQHTGTPLRAHIASTRMALAAELLGRAGITIKEVSARTGYGHPNAFRRDFKRTHGVTPRAWAAAHAHRPTTAGPQSEPRTSWTSGPE